MTQSSSQLRATNEPGSHDPGSRPGNWDEVERLLKELPQGTPLLSTAEKNNFSKYQHPPPNIYTKDQAWQRCADALTKHDAEVCKGLREEIDTLLVFAGLFSAVVTAFTIESYQWLQDDPNDAIIDLLGRIADSVGRNASTPSASPSSGGLPKSVSIRINTYWFLALALSLATALISILGKQWVREFERRPALQPQDTVGVWQIKYDAFEAWKVGGIISSLPLLLQISLAIFALGILELLWQLHVAVAIAVCVPTAATFLFYMGTTFLPLIQYCRHRRHHWTTFSLCPYRSPQAFIAFWAYLRLVRPYRKLRYFLTRAIKRLLCGRWVSPQLVDHLYWSWMSAARQFGPSWSELDQHVSRAHSDPHSSFGGLRWLRNNMPQSMSECLFNCLWHEAARSDSGRRANILHVLNPCLGGDYPSYTPHAIVIDFLTDLDIPHEFVGELFVQHMSHLDDTTVYNMLVWLRSRSLDSEMVIAFMKSLSAYTRQHIHEDIGETLNQAAVMLADFPQSDTRSALCQCVTALWLNWAVAVRTAPAPKSLRLIPWTLCAILRRSPTNDAEFVQPDELRTMQGVHALAALARTYAEIAGLQVAWPLPGGWERHFHAEHPKVPPVLPTISTLLRMSIPENQLLQEHASSASDTADGTDVPGEPTSTVPPIRAGETTAHPRRRASSPPAGDANAIAEDGIQSSELIHLGPLAAEVEPSPTPLRIDIHPPAGEEHEIASYSPGVAGGTPAAGKPAAAHIVVHTLNDTVGGQEDENAPYAAATAEAGLSGVELPSTTADTPPHLRHEGGRGMTGPSAHTSDANDDAIAFALGQRSRQGCH